MTPKKKQRKQRTKKQNKTPKEKEIQDLSIEDAFPNTTEAQLAQVQNFYKIGLSANLAYTQPGMPGRKKTQEIFRWLDEELLKNYDMDANNRQKLAKQKVKASFERLILKMEIQLSKIEKILENAFANWEQDGAALAKLDPPELVKPFKIDSSTERLRLTIITSIAEARDHIATTDYTLTIHEADEQAILEHLEMKVSKLTP